MIMQTNQAKTAQIKAQHCNTTVFLIWPLTGLQLSILVVIGSDKWLFKRDLPPPFASRLNPASKA